MVKVSIVMITYNQELYIKEAILGVFSQITNFDIELIVADDCSTDKTESVIQEIINTHPKRNTIKYTRHATNKGMMPNFIWALEQCTGKHIAMCEGDDYWTDPYKLQKQVDFLEANPEYVLCFHPVKILEPDGALVDDYITKVPENYETIETLAERGNYIHTPSVVFRNIIKSFPQELNESPIGDYFIYMLLAQYGKIGMINDVMGVYRNGVGSWSAREKDYRKMKYLYSLCLISEYFSKSNQMICDILMASINSFILNNHRSILDSDLQILNTQNAQLSLNKALLRLIDELSFKNNLKYQIKHSLLRLAYVPYKRISKAFKGH